MSEMLLRTRGLKKAYGPVAALRGVDLNVGVGEIVGIVGDNGAGKSTLLKILAGSVIPDEGSIEFRESPVEILSPHDAIAMGIETVYQDLALAPNLDIVSNIFLGRETGSKFPGSLLRLINRKAMVKRVAEEFASLNMTVPQITSRPVSAMSGGQQQAVAIARSVIWTSSLLIMDEPTAALGVREAQSVLDLIERVRERGVSVIVVSHILTHVARLADRVVVLRHGEKVADVHARDMSADGLVRLILGLEAGDEPNDGT